MTVEADENEFLARIGAMARTIHRFSTWVAGAALVVGVVTLAALWPWLAGPGEPGFVVGVVLAAVLVAAPLRVIWHGQRISAVYGHPGLIEQALARHAGPRPAGGGRLAGGAGPHVSGVRRGALVGGAAGRG